MGKLLYRSEQLQVHDDNDDPRLETVCDAFYAINDYIIKASSTQRKYNKASSPWDGTLIAYDLWRHNVPLLLGTHDGFLLRFN